MVISHQVVPIDANSNSRLLLKQAVALHDAISVNNKDKAIRLISEDPEIVNITTSDGRTALYVACGYRGSVTLVTHLLDHGANINQGTTGVDDGDDDEAPQTTPLLLACSQGHTRVVDLLLERGADPTLVDGHGTTPLMAASLGGSVECVRRLLGHELARTTINAQDTDGVCALGYACKHGHSVIVVLLLEAGADPTLKDTDGQTPMDLAHTNGHQECARHIQVTN